MGLYDWTKSDSLDPGMIRRYGKDTPFLRSGVRVTSAGKYSGIDVKQLGLSGDILPIALPKKGANAVSIYKAGFSFVAQNPFVDTVTLYWDGTNGSTVPIIHRIDGTAHAVPANNLTISGLLASTTYYVLPHWSAQNPCSIGFSVGVVGNPMICFTDTLSLTALVQQSLQGNEPITGGYASFVTPAAGGSGGGGTGGGGSGGGGLCVMVGTDIETLENVEYSETLHKCSEWWHLVVKGGASLFCTPDHAVYDWMGHRKEARECKAGEFMTMRYGSDELIRSEAHRRVCTKAEVRMPRVHLYWANQFLSHNIKIRTT